MRGEDRMSGALFSYVDVEARIAANHPLRAMRRLTNAALAELDARFSGLYQGIGRPSTPFVSGVRAALSGRTRELERLAVELYARGLSTRDVEDTFTDERGRRLLSRWW